MKTHDASLFLSLNFDPSETSSSIEVAAIRSSLSPGSIRLAILAGFAAGPTVAERVITLVPSWKVRLLDRGELHVHGIVGTLETILLRPSRDKRPTPIVASRVGAHIHYTQPSVSQRELAPALALVRAIPFGDPLPSVAEMRERLGVSLLFLEELLRELQAEGAIDMSWPGMRRSGEREAGSARSRR